jgi:tetratricopeptide (TPR) repeat protein
MTARRIIIAVVASVLCGWAAWQAVRVGMARTLAEYTATQRRDNVNELTLKLAGVNDEKAAADRAVQYLPADAETHATRADLLQALGDYAQARDEYGRAVQLRPRDYYLWMRLGMARDLNEDQEGALRALRQSVVLAPSYAPPRWQLGNLLLRMGQTDQAFAELRRGAESNPSLWPNVDDLAWGVYGRDADKVAAVIQPANDVARLALAQFFARQGQKAAAMDQFRATAFKSEKNTEPLFKDLLRSRAFREAYEVWAVTRGLPFAETASIRDGGFEGVLTIGQTGFGWQITSNLENVAMSIDESARQSGARSLRLDFHGNSNPGAPLLTQIVLVKPLTRYHLGLFALSKDFVSGGEPVISLIDASDPNSAVLAQSPPLLSDANVWREFAIDFNTNAGTQAITLTLERKNCTSNPCPAFGTVWIDSVSIESR